MCVLYNDVIIFTHVQCVFSLNYGERGWKLILSKSAGLRATSQGTRSENKMCFTNQQTDTNNTNHHNNTKLCIHVHCLICANIFQLVLGGYCNNYHYTFFLNTISINFIIISNYKLKLVMMVFDGLV